MTACPHPPIPENRAVAGTSKIECRKPRAGEGHWLFSTRRNERFIGSIVKKYPNFLDFPPRFVNNFRIFHFPGVIGPIYIAFVGHYGRFLHQRRVLNGARKGGFGKHRGHSVYLRRHICASSRHHLLISGRLCSGSGFSLQHRALSKKQPTDIDLRKYAMDRHYVVVRRIGPTRKNAGKGRRRNVQTRRKILLRQPGPLHYFSDSVFHIF